MIDYVTVRFTATAIIDVQAARKLSGMTGRAKDIALDVILGSAGVEFDNMVTLDAIESAEVRRAAP